MWSRFGHFTLRCLPCVANSRLRIVRFYGGAPPRFVVRHTPAAVTTPNKCELQRVVLLYGSWPAGIAPPMLVYGILVLLNVGEIREDRADDADHHVRRDAAAVHVEAAGNSKQPRHHQGV